MALLSSCRAVSPDTAPAAPVKTAVSAPKIEHDTTDRIRAVVERLVFDVEVPENLPTVAPGITKQEEDYKKKYDDCQAAFSELLDLGEEAVPVMMGYLEDKRQSINFRNHYMGNTVGDAVYWNIYYQMHDTPADYSRYSRTRKGRDGKQHVRPAWDGTCFDAEGGLKGWMAKYGDKSYIDKKIVCLKYILAKEESIGASDVESYYVNIHPLRVRIAELREESGEDVSTLVETLRRRQKMQQREAVPEEVLPSDK